MNTMIKLRINGLPSHVEEGATVLEAAELVFAEIPTLCHLKGSEPETSCMLCVVKDAASEQLIPACSTLAVEGMEIDTECKAVQVARRDILNLLLSEHVGDCEAPCARICPAHLDIPLMLREIERGNVESAARIAKRDLVLPVTLGHICPAPCEKGCRRAQVDTSITIRDLHCVSPENVQTVDVPSLEKKVAIIGSGPAGLACAWTLRLMGYTCSVFDEAPKAGGALRDEASLPLDALDDEIQTLRDAGIAFELGKAISLQTISGEFEGVVFAETEFSGTLFADAFYAAEHKLAVKAVANGKEAAVALDRFLKGDPPKANEKFDSKIGKLRDSEVQELVKNCSVQGRQEARRTEAARCLHCDCRKPMNCKLRKYADQYGADQREFQADERAHVQLIGHDESVVFEPGKCIKCGLCIKLTKRAGEELGLAFVGRGFNTKVSVPFGEALADGLKMAADEVVNVCPTGALSFKEGECLDRITG